MKFLLLHAPTFDPAPFAAPLAAEQIEARRVSMPGELTSAACPTVLVLDPDSRDRFPARALRQFVDAGGACVAFGTPEEDDVPDRLPDELVSAFLPAQAGRRQFLVALRAAYREAAARSEATRARTEAASRTKELGELTRIGMALSTERELDTLLEMILSQARALTDADAGSLYLVETTDGGAKRLRFKLAQNFSRPEIPFVSITMPISKASIAGYVASTSAPLVLDDAYQLPPGVEYTINRSIDEKYGYRTKSMLTIPMSDHKDQVIGVLQLINRKQAADRVLSTPQDFAQEVVPFTARTVELVSSLAGQAAVAIENSQLYASIERLFENFVEAAVFAIEQRDPTTFGHSRRVAQLTEALARTVNRAADGPYRQVSFSEPELRQIRYAGLLHDFGKVGVREQVLVKGKKLYPPDLALVKQRYAFVRRTYERDFERQRADYLAGHGTAQYDAFLAELQRRQEAQLADLDRFMKLVVDSNEPTVLPEGNFEELIRYAEARFQDLDGQERPLLSDDEARFLTIRKGSLDEAERLEIESHVTHTYNFLKAIEWTKDLADVPEIAWGHHEKLDGTGYPRRLHGGQIRIETRMMTIADIFDALTASDRPYKRAVPVPRALDILADEVKDGMLDGELFRLFADAKVFEATREGA